MDKFNIHYQFFLENGKSKKFTFNVEIKKAPPVNTASNQPPHWTSLESLQCPNCPLDTRIHKYCPLAINLVEIIQQFDGLISYEKVHLIVKMQEREISRKTTLQHGMSSLMGLAIASSGCPHTSFFAPMAHFHMPLASVQETIFRAVSSYLLSQYFLKQEGEVVDFSLEGLTDIYKNLQIVNTITAKRLRQITESDSAVNAIIILDTYAQALPFVMDSALDEIKKMYLQFYQVLSKKHGSAGDGLVI